MTITPKPSRYQAISPEAIAMMEFGESGRFEFKRDADVVTTKLLATLANWVALDPEREVAQLLVGVEEVEDEETGLTRGVPYGLAKGLDRAVSRIQDSSAMIRPIPVDLFIVEENVSGEIPFLRVEVRPTMPPHYDHEGRRQTRQGRSTRALSDDELLRIYLDREAGSFATRFRQTSDELRAAVGDIGNQVDEVSNAIEHSIAEPIRALTISASAATEAAESAEMSAHSAEAAASNAEWEVTNVQRLVRKLQDTVDEVGDQTPSRLAFKLARLRELVWWNFSVDTYKHTSRLAGRLEQRMHALLSQDISFDPHRNTWHIDYLEELLKLLGSQPRGKGTQKWWRESITRYEELLGNPTYSMTELPALRVALQTNFEAELGDPEGLVRSFESSLKD